MRILNYGSLNIDHVYQVPQIVKGGQTLPSYNYRRHAGGKGFNQSVALKRAGAEVFHAGCVGKDGLWLIDLLKAERVDTTHVQALDLDTGHALIQVDGRGENAIVLYGGANQRVTPADAGRVLENFGEGDCLLVQNEISSVGAIIQQAHASAMRIAFNLAPFDPDVLELPLHLVELFALNQSEAFALSGTSEPEEALAEMRCRFPGSSVLLTLGEDGALFASGGAIYRSDCVSAHAVDTTGAGDTFLGFFLASYLRGEDPLTALQFAAQAAAICVTRHGAFDSIPYRAEVLA